MNLINKHNGNAEKLGRYHRGWAVIKHIPIIPGGRSANELARLTGMTQQAISSVEHKALKKLRLKLLEQGIKADDVVSFFTGVDRNKLMGQYRTGTVLSS